MTDDPTDKKDEKEEKKVELLYDPDSFIIPSRDTKGHNERMQFYAQPGHINQVAAIVASRKFPFRTRGGLMRWCLDQGLKRLEQIDASIPSVTSQVDAIIDVMRTEEFRKDLARVIDMLATQINELLAKGDDDEARRRILKIKRLIGQMPKGYWRTRHVNEIDGRFGYLLDKLERASLLRLSHEVE